MGSIPVRVIKTPLRNARTSVEMIDRFYAKPLTGEMNVGMLQSRRRKRKIYDGDDEPATKITKV